jgi:hypothetical protein
LIFLNTCEFLVLALRSVEALLCVDILLPQHLHFGRKGPL